jgi:ubiquitin-like protein Pup
VRRQQQTEKRHHRQERGTRPVELEERPVSSPSPDLGREIDRILDEIDEVLEENAEGFVKNRVQKPESRAVRSG